MTAMRIHDRLLTHCVFNYLCLETVAFYIQSPKALEFKNYASQTLYMNAHTLSYLDNLNIEDEERDVSRLYSELNKGPPLSSLPHGNYDPREQKMGYKDQAKTTVPKKSTYVEQLNRFLERTKPKAMDVASQSLSEGKSTSTSNYLEALSSASNKFNRCNLEDSSNSMKTQMFEPSDSRLPLRSDLQSLPVEGVSRKGSSSSSYSYLNSLSSSFTQKIGRDSFIRKSVQEVDEIMMEDIFEQSERFDEENLKYVNRITEVEEFDTEIVESIAELVTEKEKDLDKKSDVEIKKTTNFKYASASERAVVAVKSSEEIWQKLSKMKVQGRALKTCTFDRSVERVQLVMMSTGRALTSNVDLWQGPDHAPQRMKIYLEDGNLRPFRAVIETPGSTNSLAIRNTGEIALPFEAGVEVETTDTLISSTFPPGISKSCTATKIHGNSVHTTPFPSSVASIQILIKTDGRPLNAKIELLQGPDHNTQTIEVYTENGKERPFSAVIETPGHGNVVRIVNTAQGEFPIFASVEAYMIDPTIVDSPITWY